MSPVRDGKPAFFPRSLAALSALLSLALCAGGVARGSGSEKSSAEDFSCLGSDSVKTVDFVPVSGYAGKLDPIALPRSAEHPSQLTGMRLLVSWLPLEGGSSEIRADFHYDAQYSIDYPIYLVRVELREGEKIVAEKDFDFTDSCRDPRGNPLFAGDRFSAGKFPVQLDSSGTRSVRIRVWGGLY